MARSIRASRRLASSGSARTSNKAGNSFSPNSSSDFGSVASVETVGIKQEAVRRLHPHCVLIVLNGGRTPAVSSLCRLRSGTSGNHLPPDFRAGTGG